MSSEEIARLEAEEKELAQLIAEKRKQRETLVKIQKDAEQAEKDRLEALQPLVIHVSYVVDSGVTVWAKFRTDLQEIWRSTPGHVYNGYLTDDSKRGKNFIPLNSWNDALEKIKQLPNIVIEYAPNVEKGINWYLNTPPWEIDLADNLKNFVVKIGPRQSQTKLSDLASIKWDDDWKTALVSLSEGWRIPQLLDGIDGVIYTDSAKVLIWEQVNRRARIDKLATAEDSDDERLNVLTRQVFADGKWDTFRNQLKPFQRVGITFALEANGRMLLGDATGLGKTWQEVGYCEVRRLSDKPDFVALLSVKASNIPNWEREVERLSGIKPIVCYNGHYQMQILSQIIKNKRDKLPMYIIISHETLGTYEYINSPENMAKPDGDKDRIYFWAEFFAKALEPDFFGIDEAHQMKNPSTNRSHAMRKLVGIKHIMPATASPIKSRVNEFWPSLFMVDPISFQSATKFESDWTYGGKTPKNVTKLQELLRPVFLRRKKSDVQKDLAPINRIQKFVAISENAKERYDEVMAGLYQQLATFDPSGQGGAMMEVTGILATLTRLRQICSDDKIDFTVDLAQELVDEHSDEEKKVKVLIFSQFKGTAYAIARKLGSEAICTVERKEVDGVYSFESLNGVERDKLFESARNDSRVRYVVTTNAAKEGHNIEYCDFVVFNDQYWTPEDHIQCEGRAYGRLSNPHPIDSFYVITDIDIEIWMQELLDKKMNIISETVDGIEGNRDASGSLVMALISKLKESMGWKRA